MIYVFLANGFEEIEALTPVDILRRAGLNVTTVGIGGKKICGSHGISVDADISDDMFGDTNPEAVILPGGMPGTLNLDASQTVENALESAEKNDAFICAICAAPMVLGKRGLLKGYRAACYPGFEKYLEGADVADVRKEPVITDGKRITGAGMGVAKEFSLAIAAAISGKETADKIDYSIISR